MKATFTEGYTYQDNLLSEYQHKLGHEVVILTSRQTRADNGKIITVEPCDKLLDNGVRLIRISSGNKLSQILGYNKYIGKIIQDIKPDLIFIHGLCSFIPIQAINYKKSTLQRFLLLIIIRIWPIQTQPDSHFHNYYLYGGWGGDGGFAISIIYTGLQVGERILPSTFMESLKIKQRFCLWE